MSWNTHPQGPFEAGDGQSVMLGVQTEREWRAFCTTVLQQPCLATDPRFASNAQRVAQQTALQSLIDAVFGQLTANEVLGRLDQAWIANARVNDMQVLWHHPQLQARHRLTTVDTPAGPVAALRPPASHSSHAPRMAAVLALGEHTAAILAELGYTPQRCAQLRADGVV